MVTLRSANSERGGSSKSNSSYQPDKKNEEKKATQSPYSKANGTARQGRGKTSIKKDGNTQTDIALQHNPKQQKAVESKRATDKKIGDKAKAKESKPSVSHKKSSKKRVGSEGGRTPEKSARKRRKLDNEDGEEGGDNTPGSQSHPGTYSQDRHAFIGKKFSPGSGQNDYVLSEPLPTRNEDTREFFFQDYPEFKPNLSPEEILRQGSFGGGYFRAIKSNKTGAEHHDDWHDLPNSWFSSLDESRYLISPEYNPSVCKWGCKVGQTYEAWEANGWIVEQWDCRGWFQWYCRFWRGRRCEDDPRQIGRWVRIAGEASGRWRRILLGKYLQKRVNEVEPNQETCSKGIRQTLMHWAYEPTTEHLNRFREEKGDHVANDRDDLNDSE